MDDRKRNLHELRIVVVAIVMSTLYSAHLLIKQQDYLEAAKLAGATMGVAIFMVVTMLIVDWLWSRRD